MVVGTWPWLAPAPPGVRAASLHRSLSRSWGLDLKRSDSDRRGGDWVEMKGGVRKPPSSFGSVDWLSQSSCSEPAHTFRSEVSCRNLPGPSQVSGIRKSPMIRSVDEVTSSDLSVQETPVAGLSMEPDPSRAPRVRTAFTVEQVSALEGAFQHHQYLGPLERKKLAKEMQLSEVQIKTWFQNRRMKHKRQMQDSQLNVPFSGPHHTPLAFCPPSSALGNGLQLLYPWAPLPGPQGLMLPPGSFWSVCQVEQGPLASAWSLFHRQPLTYHPDPGSRMHTLGSTLSAGPWSLCPLPETGDAF
ncbi:Homeobox protein VENTX [Tupaia chinensis]|uniref:Homeobox protein VENTX n=1 Tax=Tupaia chinensis TaxID=246437 RepID=L9KWI6_TUPCH|nr:Homeobox protein VENTX [Tupaia chinensis]